jgi:di/tricarboxylate transporter
MATATSSKIPLFLMAIMVGNGANAGALSPFAPTGIIVNGLMIRNGLPGYEVQTYLYNLAAHAAVAFLGYAVFGGLKLFGTGSASAPQLEDGTDGAFRSRHWLTVAVIASLILSVIFVQVNVGMAAFVGAAVLVLSRAADDGEAIKRMPWRVIVMVCGVTVLIALVERAQGIDLLVSLVARISSPTTVTFVVAALTAIVSVYSSTSGVVLPAFLPMVPGLAAALPGASALAIASSMNIGGHLVDVSPLSTIGALCLAGAPTDESRTLFNKLLAWGLSMCVVGAALCFLVF